MTPLSIRFAGSLGAVTFLGDGPGDAVSYEVAVATARAWKASLDAALRIAEGPLPASFSEFMDALK